MTKFEIKSLADLLCFKFRKSNISWLKRYTHTSKKGTTRVKLWGFNLNTFMASDLPAYLKTMKIKYTIIHRDRRINSYQDSIAFYFQQD